MVDNHPSIVIVTIDIVFTSTPARAPAQGI
jgi:hypothetical protein